MTPLTHSGADTARTRGALIMAERLTDKTVKSLPAPARGNVIAYDSEVKGFGARITARATTAGAFGALMT